MNKLLLIFLLLFSGALKAQITSTGHVILNDIGLGHKKLQHRSVSNPTACSGDTSMFPSYGSTAYNSITIKKGSSLGQFFDAPQAMTVSGFRFYGFSVTPSPARSVKINLICNLYKAGADSLPSGTPIASDTIMVDTVMGTSIPLSRIVLNADFGKPVKVSGPYIVVVESDSVTALAAVVCNSYANGDGKKRNLCVGSVSGKWYRCLNLNIGGTVFNAHMQMYPFVGYKLGTDFTTTQNCYANLDTLYFQNQSKKNVCGSIFYNYYVYYNWEKYGHRWNVDNVYYFNNVDGKYKPTAKKNLSIQLISTVYPYDGNYCSDTAVKTVYFKPGTPSLYNPAKACKGDTLVITVATDAGATLQWFKKTIDPKPFFEGTKYTIKNIQAIDTFYVKAVNNVCESGWLMIPIELNNYPTTLTVKNDSICSGATANLQAKTNYGELYWYDKAKGGTLLYTGSVLQTGKLLKDTQFYVIANNKGCMYAGGAKLVKAFVGSSFAPTAPKVPGDTFVCARGNSSVKLTAIPNGTDTLRWFADATGGSFLAKGSTYTYTGTKRGEGYVYVESWNGFCGSGRSAIKITIKDYPSVFGAVGDTACSNDSARLFGSTPWGQLNWYLKRSDTKPFYIGKRPVIAGLSGKNYVYYKSSEGTCLAPKFDSVEVIVNDIPKPSLVTALSVCTRANGVMQVTVPFGNVNWYDDSIAVDPLFVGSTYNLGMMLSNRTLYYQTENMGCVSNRIPLTLTVKARPASGFTYNLLWQLKLNCVPISSAGLSFVWEWGDGTTKIGLPGVHQYTKAGTYVVRLIATSNTNGCKDTADIPVLVDHTGTHLIKKIRLIPSPNPVTSGAILNIPGLNNRAQALQWTDAMGRVVAIVDRSTLAAISQAEGEGNVRVPLNLAPGLYYLSLVNQPEYYPMSVLVQ